MANIQDIPAPLNGPADPLPGFKPLYQQVRERMVRQLIDGVWKPGEVLPSEQQLAVTLGVSPGTVRKALDDLTAENLLVRRQGRGTFVAEHDHDRVLFQYFMLTNDDGTRSLPESTLVEMKKVKASPAERIRLALAARASVWHIERVRTMGGLPIIRERIILSADRFPGLGDQPDIPNNVYQLYGASFGVSVARAEERLKAVAATAEDATCLGTEPGAPLLQIDRTAYALDESPVEWRLSRCLTESYHYLSDLR